MGERLLCKQEVIGSIPFTSTILVVARGERGEGSTSAILGMKSLFAAFDALASPLRFVD